MQAALRQILLFFTPLLLLVNKVSAQRQPSSEDTIAIGIAVLETGDTVKMVLLEDVIKTGVLPKKFVKQREEFNRLRYNIYIVYPYAVAAAVILKDVDETLNKIGDNKKERKAYLKKIEKQLNDRFKGELENLTINQGQLLVKLINRQTGKNCFGIIKELKGGFSAVVWQSVALLFSNNLKREYDPEDRDKDIEKVVKEIEVRNYYQYQYQQQQQRQAKK